MLKTVPLCRWDLKSAEYPLMDDRCANNLRSNDTLNQKKLMEMYHQVTQKAISEIF